MSIPLSQSTDTPRGAYVQGTDPTLVSTNYVQTGKIWIDTSTTPSIVKYRNIPNSSWVPILTGMQSSIYDPNGHNADAFDRANHTGAQAESTITNLVSDLAGKAATTHTHTASQITDFTTAVNTNTNVAANTAARHTHSNKTLLDSLTTSGDGSGYLDNQGNYTVPAGGGGGGTGEANTGSNVGTGGVGVYKTKSGVTLQFKKLNVGSSKVTITDDTTNSTVDIDVDQTQLTITESQVTNLVSDLALKAPLSSPTFTGTVSGISKAMVGLSAADNTSDATKNSATATLTNKTISASSNTITNLPTNSLLDGAITPIKQAGMVTLTDASTVAIDAGTSNAFYLSSTSSRTLGIPSNPIAMQVIRILYKNSAGTSQTLSLTTGSTGAFQFTSDVPALTTTPAGTYDLIACIYNSISQRWSCLAYSKGV